MSSETRTPYAVRCRGGDLPACSDQLVYLTAEEYEFQVSRPDRTWYCPNCGGAAWWDDDNYESFYDPAEESRA